VERIARPKGEDRKIFLRGGKKNSLSIFANPGQAGARKEKNGTGGMGKKNGNESATAKGRKKVHQEKGVENLLPFLTNLGRQKRGR